MGAPAVAGFGGTGISPSGSQVGLVAAASEPPSSYPTVSPTPSSGLQSSTALSYHSATPSPAKTGTPLSTETPGYVPD